MLGQGWNNPKLHYQGIGSKHEKCEFEKQGNVNQNISEYGRLVPAFTSDWRVRDFLRGEAVKGLGDALEGPESVPQRADGPHADARRLRRLC